MSALPQPLQDALAPFAPPQPAPLTYAQQTALIEKQARQIASIREQLVDVLHLPFELEPLDKSATFNHPNEYGLVEADEDIVAQVIAALVTNNIKEVERSVELRQKVRWMRAEADE